MKISHDESKELRASRIREEPKSCVSIKKSHSSDGKSFFKTT